MCEPDLENGPRPTDAGTWFEPCVLWSTGVKIVLALNPAVVPAPVPLFAERLEFTV